MKFLVRVFFILFIVFIYSCNSHECNDKSINQTIIDFNSKNSSSKDVPVNRYGGKDSIYLRLQKQFANFSFEKLDTLCEYFTIRITNDFDKSGVSQVLVCKFRSNKWEGRYYKFVGVMPGASVKEIKIDSNSVTPNSGWCNFINSIFSKKILSLPNMNEIPGFDVVMADGGFSFFEIASKYRYRFYYYYSPLNPDIRFEECKNVNEILKAIEENFSFAKKIQ